MRIRRIDKVAREPRTREVERALDAENARA